MREMLGCGTVRATMMGCMIAEAVEITDATTTEITVGEL